MKVRTLSVRHLAISAGLLLAACAQLAFAPGAQAGSISGTVRDSAFGLGTPIAGICVDAYAAAGSVRGPVVASTASGVDGTYSIGGLSAGDYKVHFESCDGVGPGYRQTYLSNAPNYWRFADATPVSVGSGDTGGMDQYLNSFVGSISGVVTDSSGPVAGLCVSTVSLGDPEFEVVTRTAANGAYRLQGVQSGRVRFASCPGSPATYATEYYDDVASYYQASSVAVTEGADRPGINAVIAPAASISGTVSDGDGPAHDACITLTRANHDWAVVAETAVDASGNYTFDRLPSGSYDLIVSSCDPDALPGYATVSTRIDLTAGQALTGRDVLLSKAGSIAGNISGSGASIDGESCRATVQGPTAAVAYADSNGDYVIHHLAPGSYTLNLGCEGPTFAGAHFDEVIVAAGATTDAPSVVLKRMGTISGTVTNFAGPLEGLCVGSVSADQPNSSPGYQVTTDAAGEYTLRRGPGHFRIVFGGCGSGTSLADSYVTEYWNDSLTFAGGSDVVITDGDNVTGIDALIARKSSISGTVSDVSGPRPGICVGLLDPAGGIIRFVVSGSGGAYQFGGLAPGPYKLGFTNSSCPGSIGPSIEPEYWEDEYSAAAADPLVLDPDEQMTGIDAVVSATRPSRSSITGTVSDSDGPRSGVCVAAVEPFTGNVAGSAVSGAGGAYEIRDVEDGSYKVRFFTDGCAGANGRSVATEYYDDKPDLSSATPVVVPDNGPIGGIDATLQNTSGATTHDTVPPGGTVSSDPTGRGPSAAYPVITAITVPGGGAVAIREHGEPTTLAPRGFSLLGYEVVIDAPPATVNDPLRIVFTLDSSLLGGVDPAEVTPIRDGKAAGDCTDQTASPDPCVVSRKAVDGGDAEIVVLTSHASTWNFAQANCLVPKLIGKPLKKAKKALKAASCGLGKAKKKSSSKKPGTVIAQKPKAGSQKPAGTKVAVTVSKG